jgi:hypothetical protein
MRRYLIFTICGGIAEAALSPAAPARSTSVPYKRQLQGAVHLLVRLSLEEKMAPDFCEAKRYGSLAGRLVVNKSCRSVAIKCAALTNGRGSER